jgi:thymidylate synthase
MNSLDKQYQDLLKSIIEFGVDKQDRTGTGTKSIFGYTVRHNMQEGFPLLTTKKMAWKTMVTELLWFLRGETNIQYLLENGCHIWDGDAYQNYLKNSSTSLDGTYLSKEEFIYHVQNNKEWGEKWGELGPIYGRQWRDWDGHKEFVEEGGYHYGGSFGGSVHTVSGQIVEKYIKGIDQIANLITELKTNPDSRRLIVSAWNVGQLDQMVLPPCHYGFQVYTRKLSAEEMWKLLADKVGMETFNKWVDDIVPFGGGLSWELETHKIPNRAISLMWNQRSVDTFLGLPFNIASYGLLLEIIAKEVNMMPDQLIGNLGDTHLYKNHIEQAKEQINREPFELPYIKINDEEPQPSIIEKTKYWRPSDFIIEGYQSHSSIKAPLSN